jgi:polyhydroxyalkanoate synthase
MVENIPDREGTVMAIAGKKKSTRLEVVQSKPSKTKAEVEWGTENGALTDQAQPVELHDPNYDFDDHLDQLIHAGMANLTGGISPSALWEAYADWAIHLATSPGKQSHLVQKAFRKSRKLMRFCQACFSQLDDPTACTDPLPQDKRFADEAWKSWPFSFYSQSFLLTQQWWYNATTDVRGVTQQHEDVVSFVTRQLLDVLSPSNYPLTNPEVLAITMQQGGQNLISGFKNLVEDIGRAQRGKPPVGLDQFEVGKNMAVTPGKVVFRNTLMELIQYAPSTETVYSEPILIVPAWIMKYYILDLTQQNSLVKYLTDQGFSVFMISWKNPDASDRDVSFDDYRTDGVMAALDAVLKISKCEKVHGVGYCLGGTLLAITAAAMASNDDVRFQTLSFFAAQTDFTEAGELMLFINESQITFLEDMMAQKGYLDTKQMAGAFRILRSNDLIWSKVIHDYLMGKRTEPNAMMAWNADATRLPAKMHSEYLRQLFLRNDFAEGRYKVAGNTVALSDVRVPIFAVGAEWDHVAPWRSVYKFHLFADAEITFALTNGGHNGGIVSEVGRPDRHFRIATKSDHDRYHHPDRWFSENTLREGSWWPAFAEWLASRSGPKGAAPQMGAPDMGLRPLCDAPGTYVFQK